MELAIKDITELRKEIANLEVIESQQAFVIKKRFNSPAAIFATAFSLFAKEPGEKTKHTNLFNKDLVSILSKVILPFTLNKTIFRNSNFITKFLVNMASQRASSLITQNTVISFWDRIKNLMPKKAPVIKTKKATPLLVSHESVLISDIQDIN